MKKKLLGKCPVCGEKLVVSELTCLSCDSKLVGQFPLSKFDLLSQEEQDFALVFLKNAGNIKQIEKELNISYPTVKKMLDQVIKNLGFNQKIVFDNTPSKEEILAMLKKKEITFDEAEELLKQIGEE